MTPEGGKFFNNQEYSEEVIGKGRSVEKERPRGGTLGEIVDRWTTERKRAGRDSVSGVERLGWPIGSREENEGGVELPKSERLVFDGEVMTQEEAQEMMSQYQRAIEELGERADELQVAGRSRYKFGEKLIKGMLKDIAKATDKVAKVFAPEAYLNRMKLGNNPQELTKIDRMLAAENERRRVEEIAREVVSKQFAEMRGRAEELEGILEERGRLERRLGMFEDALRESRSIDAVEVELKEAAVKYPESRKQIEKIGEVRGGLLAKINDGIRSLLGRVAGEKAERDVGALAEILDNEVADRQAVGGVEAGIETVWKPKVPMSREMQDNLEEEKENINNDIAALTDVVVESETRIKKMEEKLARKREKLPKNGYDSLKRREILNLSQQIKIEKDELKLKQDELKKKRIKLLQRETFAGTKPLETVDRDALKQDLADLTGRLKELNSKKERLGKRFSGTREGIYDKVLDEIEGTVREINQKRKLLGIDKEEEETAKVGAEQIVEERESDSRKRILEEFDALKESGDLQKIDKLEKSNADVWIKRTSGDWQVGKIAFLVGRNLKVEWFDEKKGKRQEKFVDVSDFLAWQDEKGPAKLESKESVQIDQELIREGEEQKRLEQQKIAEEQEQQRIIEVRRKIQNQKVKKYTGGLIEESRRQNIQELEQKAKEATENIGFLNQGIEKFTAERDAISQKNNRYWPENKKRLTGEIEQRIKEREEEAGKLAMLREKLARLEQGAQIDKSHEKYLELKAYADERGGKLPGGKTLENYLSFSSRKYNDALDSYQRAAEKLEAEGKKMGFFGRRRVKKELAKLSAGITEMQNEIHNKLGVKVGSGRSHSEDGGKYEWVKRV